MQQQIGNTLYGCYKGAWVNLGAENTERYLSNEECRQLLRKKGFMVRNVYDFDCGVPTGFWYVIKDHFGGMDEYNGKMRNQVRRSMTHYSFRLIGREELQAHGYDILCRAVGRYRVKADIPSREDYLDSLEHSVENEYWGAFDQENGTMVAYALNQVFTDSCNYSVMKADPQAMKNYVYYGLIHTMNAYYLQQRGMRYVNDGARSITEHSNIQPFLIEKYHFRKAYCHLRLYYRMPIRFMVQLLYPLRRYLPSRNIRAILMQEEMARIAK